MNENIKRMLMLIPILAVGGFFLPLIILHPFHNDEFLTTIGVIGSCIIFFPYAIYGAWYIHKLGKTPTKR